jgi:hypothetical protein
VATQCQTEADHLWIWTTEPRPIPTLLIYGVARRCVFCDEVRFSEEWPECPTSA